MKRVRIAASDGRPLHTGASRTAPGVSSTRAGAPGKGGLRTTETSDPGNPALSEAEAETEQGSFAVPVTASTEQALIFDYATSPQYDHSSQDRLIRREGSGAFPNTDYLPQDLGHGTLVMSKSGTASKYLGHTAASEWLRDVSIVRQYCTISLAHDLARI